MTPVLDYRATYTLVPRMANAIVVAASMPAAMSVIVSVVLVFGDLSVHGNVAWTTAVVLTVLIGILLFVATTWSIGATSQRWTLYATGVVISARGDRELARFYWKDVTGIRSSWTGVHIAIGAWRRYALIGADVSQRAYVQQAYAHFLASRAADAAASSVKGGTRA